MGRVERATRAQLRRMGLSITELALPAALVVAAQQIDAAKGQMGTAQLILQLRQSLEALEKVAERPEKDAIDDVNAEPASLRLVADR